MTKKSKKIISPITEPTHEQLSYILENMHEGIGIVDVNEILTYVNNAFAAQVEETKENLIGKALNEVFDPSLFPFFQKETQKRLSGENSDYEIPFKTKSGATKYYKVYVAPRYDSEGKYIGAIGSMLDITDKFEASRQLIKAKEKAEESDRLKSSFLANVSHEIRTPMNGIIGFAELLDKPGLSDERRKFYVNLIQIRSRDLMSIINDIIDISKIEAGQITFVESNFNINETLNELYNFYTVKLKKLQQKKIELHKSMPLKKSESNIISDEVKLRQVLTNLIDNAIKFTETGYIEIGYKIEKDMVCLFVKDTGIGVLPSKQKIIFERFRQADETLGRTYGGSGLGLAISNAYITLLGGKIWLKSEPGKGSEFYFTIPFKKPIEETTHEKEKEFEETFINLKGKKILIVDDDPVSGYFLQEILNEMGVQLVMAEDGNMALHIFKTTTDIDLVLLDIQLPLLSGYKVAGEMKKFKKQVPIIAQTAYASEEDKSKCLEAGCNDYIKKPIDVIELTQKLKNYLLIPN